MLYHLVERTKQKTTTTKKKKPLKDYTASITLENESELKKTKRCILCLI